MPESLLRLPTRQQLQDVLDELVSKTGVPALGVAVSLEGKRISAFSGSAVEGGGDPLGMDSRFEVSCLMKFYLSLVALEMVAQGIIALDAPIQNYLPELCKPDSPDVLVRHLLSHTSGYRGFDISDSRIRWGWNWKGFVSAYQNTTQSFPPGSVFNYEHTEHVMLGEILSRVTGLSALQLVCDKLLTPHDIALGKASADLAARGLYVAQHRLNGATGRFEKLSLPPFGPFWGASLPDLTTTLDAHVTIAERILDSMDQEHGNATFSPSTIASLAAPAIILPKRTAAGIRSEQTPEAFSVGCAHYRHGLFGHNGSMAGQTCALRFSRQHKLALAVGVNAWAPYARDAAIQRTFALCSTHDLSKLSPTAVLGIHLEELAENFALSSLPGTYVGSYFGQVVVVQHADTLKFQFGNPDRGGFAANLHQTANKLYFLESPVPISITFFRDPSTGGPALMSGVHAYKRAVP